MKNKILKTLLILTTILMLILASQILIIQSTQTKTEDPLNLIIRTDRQKYLLRQKITIEGNITQDDTPPTDAAIALQIENPLGTTIAYETLTIGSPEKTIWINQEWPINIKAIYLTDTDGNPINTVKTGTQIRIHVEVYNPQLTERQVYITVTIYDANMVPIRATASSDTLNPQQSATLIVYINMPNWVCSGKALITADVYTKKPKQGGTPLAPEKTIYYCISRTQEALMEYPELPPPQQQISPGWFLTEMTLSPEPKAGQYKVYSTVQTSLTAFSQNYTTFTVENSEGYPPQASFAYWPAEPYLNQTVEFDASSSTPEGFNDTITSYQWDFGDGTPKQTKTTPTITHNYQQTGTFIVTLNVTDSEGLWSTTSKPITIYPEFGPTANFTWTPTAPIINQTITFDASNSTTGWCANTQRFSPIQSYTWNFSDGTGEITVSNPIITHNFTQPGNYTVTLKITDADGRSDITFSIIEVLNATAKLYDVNNDGVIDLKDVFAVAIAYGSFPGHPNWNPACDFNNDDKVDLKDYFPVTLHYGEDP